MTNNSVFQMGYLPLQLRHKVYCFRPYADLEDMELVNKSYEYGILK